MPPRPLLTGLSRASQFAGNRRIAALSLLFWTFTYVVLSLRAYLIGDPEVPFDPRRLTTTAAGAALYGATLRVGLSSGKAGHRRQAILLALSVIPAALAVMLFRSAYNLVVSGELELFDDARWTLVWAGYFAAWLFGGATFGRLLPVEASADSSAPAPAVPAESDETLWIDQGRSAVPVTIVQIGHVTAEGNYARIHHPGGSGLLRSSLGRLEERLAPFGFLRVHRSALCNAKRIAEVRRGRSGALTVVLDDGAELAVGRQYAPQVRELAST